MDLKYTIQQHLNNLPKQEYKSTKLLLCEKLGWSIYHLNRIIATPYEAKAAINTDQLLIIASVLKVGIENILNGTPNIKKKFDMCI